MLKAIVVALGFFLNIICYATENGDQPLTSLEQPAVASRKVPVSLETPLIMKYFSDGVSVNEYFINQSSDAYLEDASNPALKLERMWVSERGTLLELVGLPRTGQKFSAVLNIESLFLLNLKSEKRFNFMAFEGAESLDDRSGKKNVRLVSGQKIYIFFEPVDATLAHGLRYKNWLGGEDSYFDRIDPNFKERYDSVYQKAIKSGATSEDMRDFLLDFAKNDPEKRAQKVFVSLIAKLREQKTFDGYYQVYVLLKDPSDEREARRLAKNEDQLAKLDKVVAVVKRAEATKQEELRKLEEARAAEMRKREESRLAEQRRQDEIRQAEARQAQAKAEEAKCLSSPKCRQALIAEQAKCEQKILACRSNCDSFTGSGSYGSFFANLAAATMARGCYSQCKCESNFGGLLAKANNIIADNASSAPARMPSESTGKNYRCEFNCSTVNIVTTNKRVNDNSVDVVASNISDARDLAFPTAKDICWQRYKMVVTQEWGSGSLRCSKH